MSVTFDYNVREVDDFNEAITLGLRQGRRMRALAILARLRQMVQPFVRKFRESMVIEPRFDDIRLSPRLKRDIGLTYHQWPSMKFAPHELPFSR